MLRRKNRPVGTSNGTGHEDEAEYESSAGDEEVDDYDETAGEDEENEEYDDEYEDDAEADYEDQDAGEEAEYEDDEETEYEEDSDEDADEEAGYDDDADGEYDEDETDYEDDEDYEEDENYEEEYEDDDTGEDSEDEEFTPPAAATAVKRSWLASRPKAQPATGTEEEAKAVNLIDRRERLIGFSLSGLLLALAVVSYFVDRHYVDKTNLKLQAQIHREAPWILVITLVLGLAILAATYFKRRAAVGFALLLAGVALFNSDFLIGIVYLGAGLWLIFRAMRRSPRAAGAGGRSGSTDRSGTSRAGAASSRSSSSGSSRSGGSGGSGSDTTTETKSAPGRTIGRNRRISTTPSPTGRYTPPKQSRPAPPPPKSEPEPTNRLSAWLKR